MKSERSYKVILKEKWKMNPNNTTKCSKCGLDLISEETISHKCSKPSIDFWVLDDKFLVWDGFRYIPINRKVTPRRSTDDETESDFSIVLYYDLRKSRYNGIWLRCFTSSQAKERRQLSKHQLSCKSIWY